MNLSLNWLKDFTDCSDIEPKHYCDVMTITGSKVEGFEVLGEDIENVLVGKVTEMERHPDSDHLWICKLDIGKEQDIQIVTGAQNVSVGALVPAAVAPAKLPGGVEIKAGKLRGIPSNGMMCSIAELGLTLHDMPYACEDGILLLKEDCKPGDDIRDVLKLNDVAVEFEITPNRPDCLSIIGLARESSASFDRAISIPTPSVKGSADGDKIENYLSVKISEPSKCARYSARVVKNIKIEPSPLWMRMRLRACGVRPINNIVDITNYVMLEYGQPMHAFDYRCLDGGKINVRLAQEGEKFISLDNQPHTLDAKTLVIADEKKAVALAGVMGGLNSEITDDTKTVVFESANFDGPTVRIGAKKQGMRTEASGRFEKGLDAENTMPALERACELVELLGAGTVVDGIIDEYPVPKQQTVLPLEADKINKFLGISLSEAEMIDILTKLDFKIENGMIYAPSFRSDIGCMNDIAEEVIRMHGYNTIEATRFTATIKEGKLTPKQTFKNKIHELSCSMGLNEILTFTFISPKYYDKIRMPENSELRKSVVIKNPLGEDTSIMRTTALPSMLEVLSFNGKNHTDACMMYELGKVYLPRPEGTVTNDMGLEGTLPDERLNLVIGLYNKGDFYTLKGMTEKVMEESGIKDVCFRASAEHPEYHPGRCAEIYAGEKYLGVLGEIHPLVMKNYDFDKKVYCAVIDFETLFELSSCRKEYHPLPKFPSISRDLAFVCDNSLEVGTIENVIKTAGGKLLEKIALFDVYRDAKLGEDKKSVAFNLTFRSAEKTLTDEDADKAIKKVLFLLEKELGIVLRS